MNRRHILSLSVVSAFGLALLPGSALADKSLKEQLTGTWNLVSVDQTAKDGSKQQHFGSIPKGIQVIDANGKYVQIISRSDRAPFKINNRLEGTPEENRATVQGNTAQFGTWSLDEGSKTLTVRNEGGMFPNQVGTETKRVVSVSGDELKVSNPATSSGMKSDTVWRRAK